MLAREPQTLKSWRSITAPASSVRLLLYPRQQCRVISLPIYPFDHKSYWLDPSNTVKNPPTDVPCILPPIPENDLQTADSRDKRNGPS